MFLVRSHIQNILIVDKRCSLKLTSLPVYSRKARFGCVVHNVQYFYYAVAIFSIYACTHVRTLYKFKLKFSFNHNFVSVFVGQISYV